MIVPAILEHEEIQGISSRGRMGSLSRDIDSPITNYKPSDLLAELTNYHKVKRNLLFLADQLLENYFT